MAVSPRRPVAVQVRELNPDVRMLNRERALFKNKLVLYWWLGIAVSAWSVGFFTLVAVKTYLLAYPIWIPIILVLVGPGFACIIPLVSPRKVTPNYLELDSDGLWAVYGSPRSGRRLKLDRNDIDRFEGGGSSDVVLSFLPLAPSRPRLRFTLPGDSLAALEGYVKGNTGRPHVDS